LYEFGEDPVPQFGRDVRWIGASAKFGQKTEMHHRKDAIPRRYISI
jgi:hypothetical protein